tara:strand:- start:1435 stop:2358 length:924 start_codon:yes stop_codon:yes gene_type:complete
MVDNNMSQSTMIQGIPSPAPKQAGNPLAKHLRQPKIYIKLPSGGNYWPKGALEISENGEYPVYAMNAKDEITFKTPDALLNGQATVDVIQSCMPNVKDAWQAPSIDIDVMLVAIRMASFGQMLDMSGKIPGTEITKDFQLNLQTVLDNYYVQQFEDTFKIDGFTVQMKPVSYMTMTQQTVKAFEEQRIFSIVNDDDTNPAEKLARFQKAFKNLTDMNVGVIVDSVIAIQPDGESDAVTNKIFIKEFIEGTEASIYNQIADHITKMRTRFTQQPITVNATEEEIKNGAPKTFEMPIVFDQSNFFGSGS